MANDKFNEDVNTIMLHVSDGINPQQQQNLLRVSEKLKEMHAKGLVKINHSVMEVVVASYLIRKGFDVDVEHSLDGLVCDVYAQKGGTLIVEIETGFVPPEHALDPVRYMVARLISKVARYSKHADRFMLATPVDNFAQLHPALIKQPKERTREDLENMKNLCDQYYHNPPITWEELANARLHGVFVVNVDRAAVIELEPEKYFSLVSLMPR
ncbi:MAG: hypothetical protein QXP58_00875 [Thermoprotei archaeon]